MKHLPFIILSAFALASIPAMATGDHQHAAGKKTDHAAAIGKPGDSAKVSRTLQVDMNDTMRFTPARIDVRRGETIRLLVRNSGRIKHELVLGSARELKEHAALMQRFPGMEHADPNQLSLDPGTSGELIWQFTKSGNFDFACLQPGHFEAGMVGKVMVK